MANGFILLPIPESCLDCKFCVEHDEGILAFCNLMDNPNDTNLMREINVSYPQEKPTWCPIRKLPARKKPSLFTNSPLIEKQYSEFDRGWNAFLNYMEEKKGNL